MDTNVVCNFDLNDMCRAHTESGADITIAYHHGRAPRLDDLMTFTFEENQKVAKIALDPKTSKPVDYAMNIILISKALLTRLINNAVSLNQDSFVRDVIQHNLKRLNIYGYEISGFTSVFDSLQSYYDISLSLLVQPIARSSYTRTPRFTPRCATICRQFTALALQSKTHWWQMGAASTAKWKTASYSVAFKLARALWCVILSSCRALTSARAFISTASLPIRA